MKLKQAIKQNKEVRETIFDEIVARKRRTKANANALRLSTAVKVRLNAQFDKLLQNELETAKLMENADAIPVNLSTTNALVTWFRQLAECFQKNAEMISMEYALKQQGKYDGILQMIQEFNECISRYQDTEANRSEMKRQIVEIGTQLEFSFKLAYEETFNHDPEGMQIEDMIGDYLWYILNN